MIPHIRLSCVSISAFNTIETWFKFDTKSWTFSFSPLDLLFSQNGVIILFHEKYAHARVITSRRGRAFGHFRNFAERCRTMWERCRMLFVSHNHHDE